MTSCLAIQIINWVTNSRFKYEIVQQKCWIKHLLDISGWVQTLQLVRICSKDQLGFKKKINSYIHIWTKGHTQCRRLPHEWGLGKGKTKASLPPAKSAERLLRTRASERFLVFLVHFLCSLVEYHSLLVAFSMSYVQGSGYSANICGLDRSVNKIVTQRAMYHDVYVLNSTMQFVDKVLGIYIKLLFTLYLNKSSILRIIKHSLSTPYMLLNLGHMHVRRIHCHWEEIIIRRSHTFLLQPVLGRSLLH